MLAAKWRPDGRGSVYDGASLVVQGGTSSMPWPWRGHRAWPSTGGRTRSAPRPPERCSGRPGGPDGVCPGGADDPRDATARASMVEHRPRGRCKGAEADGSPTEPHDRGARQAGVRDISVRDPRGRQAGAVRTVPGRRGRQRRLDFADDHAPHPQHYAFLVDEDRFDEISVASANAGWPTGRTRSGATRARPTPTTVAACTGKTPAATSWRSPAPTAVAADRVTDDSTRLAVLIDADNTLKLIKEMFEELAAATTPSSGRTATGPTRTSPAGATFSSATPSPRSSSSRTPPARTPPTRR